MEDLSWMQFFAYGEEFVNINRRKIEAVKEQKYPNLTYRDFFPFDMLHPGEHEGIDKFFNDYPPSTPGRVLDVGLGMGATSRHIHYTYNLEIFGIDYVQRLVDISVYMNSLLSVEDKISHVQGDVCSFEFEPNSFDIAVAVSIFMHIDSNEGILNTCRALKPGGLLYIEDYYFVKNREEFTEEDRQMAESRKMLGVKTKEEMREVLREGNMEIVEMSEFGENWTHYAWKRGDYFAKILKEGTTDVSEERQFQYFTVSTNILRDLNHLSLEEIQKTYPHLCEIVDPEDLVFRKPKLTSVYRIVARKLGE